MGKRTEKEEFQHVVAPGCSFVGNKRGYLAGDVITEDVFGNPEDFKKMLASKKIVKALIEEAAPDNGADKSDKAVERKQLEESFLARGLGKPEDLSALSDDELKQLMKG
jgi:hypothetical protein